MPTIKDIAKAAGVSHGTVSNVLNKTGKVSAQKIRLVEEAARRLGYVPNTQAQMLRQGAANHVAVMLPSLRDDRYRDLFLSVQSGLSAQGLGVLVYNTDDIAAKEELVLSKLPVSNLAGVVSVSCLGERAPAVYRELPCPVVAANRSIGTGEDRAFVTFDHYQAGCDIGKHILEQGWRHIAFFCTAGKQSDESGVFAGMTDLLENTSVSTQKFSCDTQLIINKAFDILHDDHPYDAVVTTDNLRCRAVAVAAGFLDGFKQPQIVSLGASQTFSDPFVKTYEMDYGQLGARIVEMLLGRIHDKRPLPQETTLPPKGFSFRFPALKVRGKGELRLLTLESPSTAALGKIIPMFRRLTGLELKITSMSYNDLYDHLALINKNFYYDLIRIDAAWLESMGSRLYLPVEELGMEESLTPNLVSDSSGKYCISDGVRCALPFDPSVQIFLYRSDLFEDATLRRLYYERYREQLMVPDTMERYAHVAEFFTKTCTPDSPTLYGTTITNGGAETAACDFLPYYLAEGGTVCDELGRVRMDTPEMRAALERYRQMQRYASGDESVWWRDSVRQFADGTAATAHTFSNHAAYIINSKRSNVVGKTGVAVMPGGRPLLGGGVLGACKYSGKLEACQAFFQWFYTKDIASAMVRLGGTSPLIESYNNYENFSVFPWLSVARDSFAIGVRGSVHPSTNGFSNRRYEYALGTAVRNVLNRSMTPAEAVRFAQTMYDSMDSND